MSSTDHQVEAALREACIEAQRQHLLRLRDRLAALIVRLAVTGDRDGFRAEAGDYCLQMAIDSLAAVGCYPRAKSEAAPAPMDTTPPPPQEAARRHAIVAEFDRIARLCDHCLCRGLSAEEFSAAAVRILTQGELGS